MEMRHFGLAVLLGATTLSVSALECDRGTLVDVSGTVDTVNQSETIQTGRICLTLTDGNGAVLFDGCGGVLGQIVKQDPTAGTARLNHFACFDGKNCLFTRRDRAAFQPDGSVVETIRRVSGKGIFEDMEADIQAAGWISPAGNHFDLSGKACLETGEDH